MTSTSADRRDGPAYRTIYHLREAAHDVIAESAVVFAESFMRAKRKRMQAHK